MNNSSQPRQRRGSSSRSGSSGGGFSRGGRSQGGSTRQRHSSNYRGRSSRGGGKAQKIDPRKFVKAAKPIEQDKYVADHSFSDFALVPQLQDNLAKREYVHPTQIQDKAIPAALDGHDVIGIANTGTGKTAAFLLPLLNKMIKNKGQKVIIVAPTRELAMQIQQEARSFTRGCGLYDTLLIGGTPMGRQLRDLRHRPEVIIGTPGRIKDHIERKTLKLGDVANVVLDEVDRMLDMGFINDIKFILAELPKERQSFFFSATLSKEIDGLIRKFTDNPISIMARTADTSDNVEQSVMRFHNTNDKFTKLHELLMSEGVDKSIIFTRTKRGAEKLAKELAEREFLTEAIHGNKSQGQRQRALRKFKESEVSILTATDVAARGIDVDGITHVINYDIPQTYDDYTHRIGRTGRGGNMGHAVTFVEG